MSPPIAAPAASPRRNLILQRLADAEFDRLLPLLERVSLEAHDQIYARGKRIEHVLFPVDLVGSVLAVAEGRPVIEVATVGYEGVTGISAFLGTTVSPHDNYCQIPGDAMRLAVEDLHGFLTQDGELHGLLNRYTQATIVQLAQNVACNRAHSTEERCARWLLQTRDRVGADEFPLTQDFLAQMLGVRRGTVSLTAGVLQQAGLIRYARGRITIADTERLHETACDCYDIVQAEYLQHDIAPEA